MIEFRALPPRETIDYFRAKGYHLPTSFRWEDVWQAEHGVSFTVAKSAGFDILGDIYAAALAALEDGTTFDTFKKRLIPTLQDKGWWGKKALIDPLTGETVNAQLGSVRRLQLIFDMNMRTSRAVGDWAKIKRQAEARPWLRYVAIMDGRTRPEHARWHGLILRWDHPFWKTHYPPNGWRCRCSVLQYSDADLARRGWVPSPDPEIEMREWTNPRTGDALEVPLGIDPGFAYNPGEEAVAAHVALAMNGKLALAPPALAAEASAASAKFVAPIMERAFRETVLNVTNRLDSGLAPRSAKQAFVAGFLPRDVLGAVEGLLDRPLASGAITVDDVAISHMYRASKRLDQDALSPADILRIPDILSEPDAILWSKRDFDEKGTPTLLYIFSPKNGRRFSGKIAVKLERRVKTAEMGRIQTNELITGGVVDDPRSFMKMKDYTLIWKRPVPGGA